MEHPQKIVDIDVIMDVRDTTSAMSMDVVKVGLGVPVDLKLAEILY